MNIDHCHNGVKSVKSTMSKNVIEIVDCLSLKLGLFRLAVGIGRPKGPRTTENCSDYVLSKFNVEQKRQLEEVAFPKLMDMIDSLLDPEHLIWQPEV